MFRSLRWRLILSYVLVIFVCLSLASSAVGLVLRDHQQRSRLDELGYASAFISLQLQFLESAGAPPRQIVAFLREQSATLGVRIFLTDRSDLILEDTADELDGQRLAPPSRQGVERAGNPFRRYYVSVEQGLFLVGPPAPFVSDSSQYTVILAVPQANVAQAWLELLPSLLLAAAVSLVVSILVALLLTRSIARPLVQMTRASEAMARGPYDQSIPVRGHDEIARLASAFNGMAYQVSSSDRTMRDFLANVSHELKTPLTSIQGFSQAMLDGTISDQEQARQAATIVNDEANRMRVLVDDLLTLSKLESGQIAMGEEELELDQLLREALRRIEWQAEAKSVRVTLESRPGPIVRGDPHWLLQIFSNLLDNAVRHTPIHGLVMVRASVGEGALATLVTVHNTGSFIPRDDLPRVFERFFQVDRSRANRHGNTGLGLAIVREVVQAHGGTVEAASDPANGTTFYVRLPAAVAREPDSSTAPASRVA